MRNHLSAIIVLYPLCPLSPWTFPRECSVWGCPLAGECTWLLEAFVWGQVWNLFLTSFSFLLLGGETILWAIYSRVLKMVSARACLKFVFFFLLNFDQEPNLIGNILLATAWNWLYCTPDIFVFVVLPLVYWTLAACHQLIFRETSPGIFFSCKFLWNHECLSIQQNGLVLAQTIKFQMITAVRQRFIGL